MYTHFTCFYCETGHSRSVHKIIYYECASNNTRRKNSHCSKKGKIIILLRSTVRGTLFFCERTRKGLSSRSIKLFFSLKLSLHQYSARISHMKLVAGAIKQKNKSISKNHLGSRHNPRRL